MRLPFPDGAFDTVVSTGSIALFKPSDQRAALGELARVTRCEMRLLESFEKKRGLYMGRFLAFLFDGMRPIPQDVFQACGLDCQEEWDIFGGAFSYLRASCPAVSNVEVRTDERGPRASCPGWFSQ
jgi:hypothetical protein